MILAAQKLIVKKRELIHLIIVTAFIILVPLAIASPEPTAVPGNNLKTTNLAFLSSEKLTYTVSWSKVLKAGTAVMQAKEETTADGKHVYRLTSTAKSSGVVRMIYPVSDLVQGVMDADELCSLSYSLNQHHGKRKKVRIMTFDQANSLSLITENGSAYQTFSTPEHVQDPLSALYYVRTREDLDKVKSLFVDVHDDGKNWAVEIQVLGKEKISTPAGTFNTIKVKTFPKYEGVFQHKGEIFIWFTDDERRIPVLMKSTIAIGSIVATLTEIGK